MLSKVTLTDGQAIEMLKRAKQAEVNTYPEAGGYTVSVLTSKGNIYQGVSYKSATLTLTMYCEATALANAAIHGEKEIIAITGPNCHMCKQLIWEAALYSGNDILIVMANGDSYETVPISSLMPYPWPDEYGDKR